MARLRRPLPRRALLAAALGALYGLTILPAPQTVIGVTLPGVTWFVLSLCLLFVLPIAFHVYSAWAILWLLYLGITLVPAGALLPFALHLPLPLASLALLMTSGYLELSRAPREYD